jgi:hypothetical protein
MRFHPTIPVLGGTAALMLTAARAGVQGPASTSGPKVHLARRYRPAIPICSASGPGPRIQRPNDQIHRVEEQP